jgi:S-adenosylmethionine:tRNA ribosyltransferase-isomerase
MRTAEFDFALPPELVAQQPASQRDASRLLVLDRATGGVSHRAFAELPGCLVPGDVLVLNNSRVLPARLRAQNVRTGGQFEVLLTEECAPNDWWALLRPGKRAQVGTALRLRDRAGQPTPILVTVTDLNAEGHRRLRFEGSANLRDELERLGETPLPPYIARPAGATAADRERYQTVFADPAGSIAAPTAGLHFTEDLLGQIRARGVAVCFVTLHVGLGTFAPVKSEFVEGHQMHPERYELSAETADTINRAKREGRRVIAVGTTSVRVLESATGAQVVAGTGRTRIFIHPPYRFRVVDALVTNFHWPQSTLLMLVSAFAAPGRTEGRELVLAAYAVAVRERYRFFSYGDAMFLL